MTPPLVLASASPQRRAILERLGVTFTVRPADVVELEEGEPGGVAVENALRKARAVLDPGAPATILGVDTLVALEGRIYGKPADERHARETLRALSGATHTVFSGVALLSLEAHPPERTALAGTEVTFRVLDEKLIDWYVAAGEWRGRSGGYAIQGVGAALVRAVRGEHENVVGLPLATLLDLCPELLGK
ncbi:MAG: Maf family protein [Solirubrobacterales bacterium]